MAAMGMGVVRSDNRRAAWFAGWATLVLFAAAVIGAGFAPADAGWRNGVRKAMELGTETPRPRSSTYFHDLDIPIARKEEFRKSGLPKWMTPHVRGKEADYAQYAAGEFDEAGNLRIAGREAPVTRPEDLDDVFAEGSERQFVVRESDAYAHRAKLAELTRGREFQMAVTGAGRPRNRLQTVYVTGKGDPPLNVQHDDGLWIAARSRGEYGDTAELLRETRSTGEIDVASFFDSGERNLLGRFDEAVGVAHSRYGANDAQKLLDTVGSGRNRTIIVVGHVEDGAAVIRGADGRIAARIPLDDLQRAADESDNNLIFLGCETAETAVGGFRAPVRTGPIADALKRSWDSGDFRPARLLSELGQQGDGFVVSGKNVPGERRQWNATPRSPVVTGPVMVSAVRVNALSASRQRELEDRWFPWLPTQMIWPIILSLIALAMGPKLAWRSWASATAIGTDRKKRARDLLAILGFVTVGFFSLAAIRISAFVFAVITEGGWRGGVFGLLILVAFGTALIVLLPLYALIYLLILRYRNDENVKIGFKDTLAFGGLCFASGSALASIVTVPLILFELGSESVYVWTWVASMLCGLGIAAMVKLHTPETPVDIFKRLWDDPFWPFKRLLRSERKAMPV